MLSVEYVPGAGLDSEETEVRKKKHDSCLQGGSHCKPQIRRRGAPAQELECVVLIEIGKAERASLRQRLRALWPWGNDLLDLACFIFKLGVTVLQKLVMLV